jgi:hypothetical protein
MMFMLSASLLWPIHSPRLTLTSRTPLVFVITVENQLASSLHSHAICGLD